jgi:CRISPR-associated protein Csm2
MIPEPMEKRLSKEWSIKSEHDVKKKLFENYTEGDKLADILDAEKLVVLSFAMGNILSGRNVGLKASKLRQFYEALLNIKSLIKSKTGHFQANVIPQILLLKPKLAYEKARAHREITPFFEIINPLPELVSDEKDYNTLCNFVEAILAYHKYCGGRE